MNESRNRMNDLKILGTCQEHSSCLSSGRLQSTSSNDCRLGRNQCCTGVGVRHSLRCSSARQPRSSANDELQFMPIYCVPSTKNEGTQSTEAPAPPPPPPPPPPGPPRLRGGGSREFLDAVFKTDTDFMWRNNRFMMPTRLEGGGSGRETSPMPGCGKTTTKSNFSRNYENETNPACLVGNRCCRKNSEKIPLKQPVFRSENDNECVPKKKNYGVCMKKPCLGTDCLIRAFKDTQDFVNSIGKVPGLAGLGITESPYFGKTQESKENKKSDVKPVSIHKQSDANNHLHSSQTPENIKKMSQTPTHIPGGNKKTGIVQEATTALTDPTQISKSKKKDDKNEKQKELESQGPPAAPNNEESPCGEPKCKSRPKRPANVENTDNATSNAPGDKFSLKNEQKNKAKHSSGPGGDLNKNSKSNPGKTNAFVYSYGNNYPTSVYGHKNCNFQRHRVPANQGWLWNEVDTIANRKPRTGWKPGAISVLLRDMMNAVKAGFLNERPKSAPSRSKKNQQKVMTFNALKKPGNNCNEEQSEEESFPPTLHIHRRDGDYYITMYPIRPDVNEPDKVDEPLNPLQFKIVKSKDSLASSSIASDMEIEFSPPAAVNRIRKKPNVIHVETNVTQQEIFNEIKSKLNISDKTADTDKEGSGKAKKDKSKKKQKKIECI